jgi:phosphate starvation-inducible PhoH-like protein
VAATEVKIAVPGNHLMLGLLGQRDELLRLVEDAFPDATVLVRGNEITVAGDGADLAARTLEELVRLLQAGQRLETGAVRRAIDMVKADERPSEVLSAEILRASGGRVIRPKSSGQKNYVDAIRRNVITFGIGPAGTGKSWLAVACAVQALQDKLVDRIILTRPAVEAGERLGFLPGDLMAKVDPYLRPLYDALHDMVGTDGAAKLLERGEVEVAPLAFMRGRAQPVDRRVLTPWGWRPIGNLEVGDLVVASDGKPTLVLGVYPQGRRPVFEVRTQDGATTQACAEHLWFVKNIGRVLRTDEMAVRLRDERLELPLISAPVEFAPQPVHARAFIHHACADPHAIGMNAREMDQRTSVLLGSVGERRRMLAASPQLDDDVVFLVRSLGGIVQGNDVRLPGGVEEPRRFVESIEPAGEAETVCIQVAAADSLYVTDDFLVTHNTLNSSFIICDEAQNTTPEQMKMFLTRIGFGSRAVVTGDVTQVDVQGSRSGLLGLESVLSGIDGLEWVRLSSRDVVRHRIVQDIVDAYERAGSDQQDAGGPRAT